jgi:hypothetical protein
VLGPLHSHGQRHHGVVLGAAVGLLEAPPARCVLVDLSESYRPNES